MAITDELRAEVHRMKGWCCITDTYFDKLCDLIDAEHEAMLEDARKTVYEGYIELPKDVNGELVDIGDLVDEMLPFGGYANPAHVDTMELYRSANGYGWMVKLDAENRALISPKLLRHHKQPTVEDVLRDMHMELNEVTALYVGEAIDSDERDHDAARIFAKYATKLRLAGDAE